MPFFRTYELLKDFIVNGLFLCKNERKEIVLMFTLCFNGCLPFCVETVVENSCRFLLQARSGDFSESVQTAMLPALLDGGLVFILRWSLDNTTESTIAAAVNCFHALLVSEPDEVRFSLLCWWPRRRHSCSRGRDSLQS